MDFLTGLELPKKEQGVKVSDPLALQHFPGWEENSYYETSLNNLDLLNSLAGNVTKHCRRINLALETIKI